MKFEELSELSRQFNINDLEDNSNNKGLNDAGEKLLNDYNMFIDILKEWIQKEEILNILAYISSTKCGTEKFKLASSLYSLTNNGATKIDLGTVAIHRKDDIINYIEK